MEGGASKHDTCINHSGSKSQQDEARLDNGRPWIESTDLTGGLTDSRVCCVTDLVSCNLKHDENNKYKNINQKHRVN